VQQVDELYGHHLAAVQTGGSRLAAAPAIAQAVNAFARSSPERVARAGEKLARYSADLAAAGLEDRDVRPAGRPPTPGQTLALLVGFPIMVAGVVTHWLPYQLPRLVALALVRDSTFVSTIKLITGTVVFLGGYVAAGFFAVEELGLWPGLAIALSLPVAGIVAIEEIEALRARARRRERRKKRARTPPAELQKLEREREDVIGELDRARADFLHGTAPPVEDGLA
jgi:hypothetical protein